MDRLVWVKVMRRSTSFPTTASRTALTFMSGALLAAVLSGPLSAQQTPVAANPSRDDINAIFAAQPCIPTKALTQLDAPITRVSKRLAAHEPIKIVAVGSSSTAGSGASSPDFSYPSRLGRELQQRFPRETFSVVNLGVNGQEAADMVARLDAVLEPKPDLVIWQVGTNTVLRDNSVSEVGDLLHVGIARIKETGADVLLIDPQFAPRVNAKPAVNEMVGLIGQIAKRTHVPLFRRYVAMRHWHEDQAIAFDRFITDDGLHMNDWGYACFARLLADNIVTAIARTRAVADVKPQQ